MAERSVSYPSYLLSESLDLVKQIYENFGTSIYAPREEIAKMLHKAEVTVQQPVGTAKQYGLVEMKSGQGYKPSELFLKIHKPLSEQERRESLIKAFSTPDMFGMLINEFNNNIVPAIDPLSNVLLRKYGIKGEDIAKKVATIFIENAKSLNLIGLENILKIDGPTIATVPVENSQEAEVVETQSNTNASSAAIVQHNNIQESKPSQSTFNNGFNSFNIPLKSRKRAQLLIPDDVAREDFDTIIKWVYLMKESYE